MWRRGNDMALPFAERQIFSPINYDEKICNWGGSFEKKLTLWATTAQSYEPRRLQMRFQA